MRRFWACFIFITFSLSVQATVCVERFFTESYVNMYLCQNHANYNEVRTLLFEARVKVLNAYIFDRIEKSLLQDKKFEIQIYDSVLTSPHLELTQGKKGYFINISGFPTLEKLIQLVDYFSKSNWQPFIVGYDSNNSDNIEAKIANFYTSNTGVNSSTFQENSFSVWRQDDLHLKYVNDRLQYYTNETLLPIEATSSLPIKIKDRFLLFQHDMIFVLEEQKITKKLKISAPISEDYDSYQYTDWVNICNGGEDNWLYSYSYRENRFYKRT